VAVTFEIPLYDQIDLYLLEFDLLEWNYKMIRAVSLVFLPKIADFAIFPMIQKGDSLSTEESGRSLKPSK